MDEGFKIRIGQNISAHLVDNSGSQMKFNNNPSYHNVTIQITKKDSAETGDIDREDFLWEDVKDQIIPFFLRLEKIYDIEKFRLLTEEGAYFIKSDFEEELDELPYQKVSYIDIFLSGEKEKLNESLSPKEELEDFCDTHLAYLTDEGFSIDYEELYGGHCTNITIRHSKRDKNKYSHDFSWDEVKDRFIPFLQMLSKEYKLFNFHHEDFNCKRNQVVCMRRLANFVLLSSDYYSYDDVIKDTINADFLFYIKLKVGGKLT
jgi:hypothetical protein